PVVCESQAAYALASCQVTHTTGSRSVCVNPGLRQEQPSVSLRPVASTKRAYSARVTGNFPSANAVPTLTGTRGASSKPIMNLPGGTMTISGHSAQSRNTEPGAWCAVDAFG